MNRVLERIMTDIWQDVLGVEDVGPTDNFFELGGNSILASSLVERVTQTFGLPLAFDEVFQHPTIAELSAYVHARQGSGAAGNRAP